MKFFNLENILFKIETKNIHLVEKCVSLKSSTLLKHTILHFFRISHIIFKKYLHFRYLIILIQFKKKNIHLIKKCCE